MTSPRVTRSSLSVEGQQLKKKVEQLQKKIIQLECLVFVQEVEISVWKTRAIRMKETTQMDKDNPSSPRRSSKRGPESFKRFSSPKKLCAMVIETLSTPDKETGVAHTEDRKEELWSPTPEDICEVQ